MPQLDPTSFPSQLFWLGVCFLVLYLLLSYIALPKISQVLEAREQSLEEKINTASTYREQAENLLAEYEEILKQAREKAQHHTQSVSHMIAEEVSHRQRDFLNKLNERLRLAEQDLYRTRVEVGHEIKPMANEIALFILKKFTGRDYGSEDLPAKRKKV